MKQNNTIIGSLMVCATINTTNAFVPTHASIGTSSTETCLTMSKNSDRARLEKNLEDMMDRDWRVFRAQLVAEENVESREAARSNRSDNFLNDLDEKQERFGSLFSAFFNNHKEDHKKDKEYNIFDGNFVGGATPSSMIPESCEDPFVSAAEIPVLLKPKVSLNKHRWAHQIPHIEPGCVLIANEKLGGVFHQTVVLIIAHNEAVGSTGIVINRPMDGNLLKIASETDSNVDLSLKMAFNSASVTYGGPVMTEEYSILHGYGEVEGSQKVAPGVFVGGSEELMNEVRKHNLEPKDALFVKGHAAWVPNQLSREISKGVWYVASCSTDFILRYAGAPISDDDNETNLWSDILTSMGGELADIPSNHIGKGDRRPMP